MLKPKASLKLPLCIPGDSQLDIEVVVGDHPGQSAQLLAGVQILDQLPQVVGDDRGKDLAQLKARLDLFDFFRKSCPPERLETASRDGVSKDILPPYGSRTLRSSISFLRI